MKKTDCERCHQTENTKYILTMDDGYPIYLCDKCEKETFCTGCNSQVAYESSGQTEKCFGCKETFCLGCIYERKEMVDFGKPRNSDFGLQYEGRTLLFCSKCLTDYDNKK